MTEYQVVGECAHVETEELGGAKSLTLLYKGSRLPAGVPEARIRHLLDAHLIAPVGEVPIAPNSAVPQDPETGLGSVTSEVLRGEPAEEQSVSGSDASDAVAKTVVEEGSVVQAAEQPRQASTDTEAEARRADARAKLAESGGVPDGRSSDAVMVEFLVGKGYDRAEAEKADRAQLKALVAAAK
ncbi:hypothetical protein FHR83_006700 [Actinoplanes campanulatus]|uniref:Uncharacterized protein n=1 Tax=Actinoplanes campanulatus TaxID=113559 RepID=A0A7W5FHU4_9ACTN|nr:hypothetical protein [Actinoplanes campanulatus]MBB3098994.1 hypothetical protein [Actinoplanes campanulatus]GGN39530.1 hypothetical protein GCM10010109_67560 [Actinoplanes campanulatus]GID40154.1 hypothetical protein Aca09nite_66600 [Actinoplanes campanulatus]